MRGIITDEIKEKSKNFLQREITAEELRLYPYIDYCVKNCGYYDRNKISGGERIILAKLKQEKHIDMISGQFYITKPFYDFMQEILWMSYIETKCEEE